MDITSDTLDALRVDFQAIFDAAYDGQTTFYQEVSTEVDSDTAANVYGWVAKQVRLRKWVGPRIAQNLIEHAYTLPNDLYEGTLELKRTQIEDDKLGTFRNTTIPNLAKANAKHPDQMLIDLLKANPNGFDSVPLFSASHPNFNRTGVGATTYANDFTVDLDQAGFDSVYSAMSSIVGEDGEPLENEYTLLMVPPQLRLKAQTLMNSTTYAVPGASGGLSATVDNAMRGWCDVLVVQALSYAPKTWYLLSVNGGLKPFIHQTRDTSELVARDNPMDPKVFDLDLFTYGTRVRDAAGISLPFLIARSIAP